MSHQYICTRTPLIMVKAVYYSNRLETKWNQFYLWANHSTSSAIQKEAYAIFACCTKLDPLLRDRKFIIHTDHKNLTYMKSTPSSIVGRWSMALQELDYTIAYVRGSENTVADAISRLCAILSDLVIKVRPETTGTELDNLPGPFCGALKVIPDMTDEQRDALHICHNKTWGR